MQTGLSLKQLREMARNMTAAAFREQLGPIALVERPDDGETSVDTGREAGQMGPTSVVQPELILARMLLLALETEDMRVATLPPLRSCDELSVGRQPDCDLVIDHDSVTKRHAVLRWNESAGSGTLEDLGSTNGTFINTAHRIEKEVTLDDGDFVSFGDVAFWFLLVDTLHARLTRSAGKKKPSA